MGRIQDEWIVGEARVSCSVCGYCDSRREDGVGTERVFPGCFGYLVTVVTLEKLTLTIDECDQ